MKNKVALIIWVISAIIAFILIFYIKGTVKPENVNPILDKEILFNLWMHQIDNWQKHIDLSNESIKMNIDDYIANLYNECKKIVSWSGSKIIQWYGFLDRYNDALWMIDSNEYVDKNNIVDWKCDEFEGENKLHCEIFASKDLTLLDENKSNLPLYNYFLLKSLISKNNLCNNLLTDIDQEDCKKTYNDYMLEQKNSEKEITMYSTKMELWKFLSENWSEQYRKVIDDSFIDRCHFYIKDFKERIYNPQETLWE